MNKKEFIIWREQKIGEYKKDLEILQETLALKGMTFSSIRSTEERRLKDRYDRDIAFMEQQVKREGREDIKFWATFAIQIILALSAITSAFYASIVVKNETKNQLLFNRPYVYLEEFRFGWEEEKFNGYQHVFIFKNSGNLPARIKIEKYCYITNEQYCSDVSKEGIIFPNSDATNLGVLGNQDDLKKEIEKNNKIDIIYRLNYGAVNDIENKAPYFYEVQIEIFKDPKNPANFLHRTILENAN